MKKILALALAVLILTGCSCTQNQTPVEKEPTQESVGLPLPTEENEVKETPEVESEEPVKRPTPTPEIKEEPAETHQTPEPSVPQPNPPSAEPAAPEEEPVEAVEATITTRVTGLEGEVLAEATLNLEEVETPFKALELTGLSVKHRGSGSLVYVTEVEGLAERAHGPLSGWMFSVNGESPNKGSGAYKLKEGDEVTWYYANAE